MNPLQSVARPISPAPSPRAGARRLYDALLGEHGAQPGSIDEVTHSASCGVPARRLATSMRWPPTARWDCPPTRAPGRTGSTTPASGPRPPIATIWPSAARGAPRRYFRHRSHALVVPARGRADEAGRRRLAVRRARPRERCATRAARPHLPRRTGRRVARANHVSLYRALLADERLRGLGRARRRPLQAGRDPARARASRRPVPARGDRLQPRLRAAAAAPADHRVRARGARPRSALLPPARHDRQRVDRSCAEGAAGRVRLPAARRRPRRVLSAHAARLPAERTRRRHRARRSRASTSTPNSSRCWPRRAGRRRRCIPTVAASPAARSPTGWRRRRDPGDARRAGHDGLDPPWRARPRKAASGARCTTSADRCSASSTATRRSCCATGSPTGRDRPVAEAARPRNAWLAAPARPPWPTAAPARTRRRR